MSIVGNGWFYNISSEFIPECVENVSSELLVCFKKKIKTEFNPHFKLQEEDVKNFKQPSE